MTLVSWRRFALVLFVVAAGLADVWAGTFTLFGPRTFTRSTGEPIVERVTFQAPAASGYLLYAESQDLASAIVTLNGTVVFDTSDFRPSETTLTAQVTLKSANVLTVELRSKPGTSLRLWIVGTDDEPPTIRAIAAPTANPAGWNNQDVTVTFDCSDAVSGIAQCPAPIVVSSEGAAQVVSGEAVDVAGNRATGSVTLNIDRTAPTIVASATPAPNAEGWHNSDVTVAFACADALSGVAACSGDLVVARSGAGIPAIGAASDLAGNAATATLLLNIDRTAPQITAKLSAPPNPAGWHSAPVTVEFECADDGAGVASCPAPVTVAAEGSGQVVKGVATDRAGNSAEASVTVNVDLTDPHLTATLSQPANDAGWHRGPVTVAFTCEDGLSGIVECPSPHVASLEGLQTVSATVSDRAGRSASYSIDIRIDSTPPAIAATPDRAPDGAGWYNAPVTVTFACSDTGSEIATCTDPAVVSTDGAGQTIVGTATDRAGNTSTASIAVSLDTVPPVIRALASAGWSAGDVVVTFECSDGNGSGIATCPAPITVTAEGSSAVAGEAIDRAGNVATLEVTVNIDRTAPGILAVVTPAAGAGGWHNSAATVTFECTDALSGIASCAAPVTVEAEGAGQVVSGTARDAAGNRAIASATLNIDRTGPSLTVTSPTAGAILRDPAAAISGTASDTLSGVRSVACAGTAALVTGGTFQCTVALVQGPNSIEITAADQAGNVTRATLTVTYAQVTNSAPVARAGGPYAGETGAPIRFDGSQSSDAEEQPLTFKWTFGDSGTAAGMSVNRTFAEPGSYVVELSVTDTEGASSSSTTTVTVTRANRAPVADAGGPYTGDAAQIITFTAAASGDPDGDPLSYFWSFGDGTTAAGAVVRRSYATPGTYTASVTVTDGRGGTDTASAPVTVRAINQRPTAQVGGPYSGQAGQVVQFSGSGSDPDGDPLTYTWSFGDGGTATGASALHTFAAAGTFSATLTVSDGRGGTHAASTQVLVAPVNQPPIPRIDAPERGDVGRSIVFSGAGSSDPDGDPLTYSWSFGDGRSGSGPAANHSYQAAGTYGVTLTVFDSRGASVEAKASITIDPLPAENRAPLANAGGPYAGEVNLPVAFNGAGSSDPDGDALTCSWDFGDGTTASGVSPLHAFVEARAYSVTLTVTDGRGGSHSSAATVTIAPPADRSPPVLTLQAPSQVLPGTRVRVQADVYDNVAVASVTFEAAGAVGQPLLAPPYEHEVLVPAVAAPGATIPVKATARDASGNAATAGILLTIGAEPDNQDPTVVLLAPASAAPGTTIRLTATAHDNDGIASVTFTVGGAVIGVDTLAPYEAAYAVPADTVIGAPLQAAAAAVDYTGNRASTTAAVAVVETPDTTPPVVQLSAPDTVPSGGTISISAAVTDDTGVAAVIFFVDGTRIATVTSGPYTASYPVPPDAVAGRLFRVEARAVDLAGLEASDVRHTRLVVATPVVDAFLIGEVYDDTTGLPVAGAVVNVAGNGASLVADERGRFALAAGSSEVVLRVSREGYTTVERRAFPAAGVRELIDVRLTPRAASAVQVTPILGGTIQSGSARLSVPPGSVTAAVALSLTVVGPQGLAGLSPTGWSPVAVADIAPQGVAFAAPAALAVPLPAGGDAGLMLAVWDRADGAWRAVAAAAGGTSELAAAIPATGQYAWLRPDTVPAAPVQPAAGQLVTGVPPVDVPQEAETTITPEPRVIFYQPGVRASVRGVVTSPLPLPSGTRLWARISESYRFFSGAEMYPDPTTQDIFFYQSTPAGAALAGGLNVSPSRTFEALTLERGVIGIDLFVPAEGGTPAAVIAPAGGTVSLATGERLEFREGATATAIAASLRRLALEELGVPLPAGLEFLGAVDVAISGGAIDRAGVLSLARPASLPDDAQVLLVRLATVRERTQLVLVAVGRIEGDRLIADPVLPLNQVAMEGVSRSGRYIFIRPAQAVGFVAGQVIDAAGAGVAGAGVSTVALPIGALSRGSGAYAAAAPVSPVTLTAVDPQSSDRATGTVTLTAARQELALDLRLVAEPPRVTSVSPAAGATGVPQSTGVIAIFSEPIDPATLTGNVSLSSAAGPIEGAVSVSGGNTLLTFRPASALEPDTQHTFTLGASIADASGQAMGAEFVLTFSTLDTTAPPPPPAGALSATIPEDGNTTVRGSQGIAGLHDTVSIENVTRGTSTPVLLDPNGGFLALVQAAAGDRLQLKIVDASGNDTLVDLPAFTRQNADGSISGVVGSAGGRVDGPDGTAVDVPQGSLPDGTIVTIRSVAEASFPVQLDEQQRAAFPYAGGVQVDFGGVTPKRYVNISVPARTGDTADDQWIVGQVIEVGGQQVLNAVDTARLKDGRVRTSSPPCPGVLAAGTYGIYKSDRPVGLAWGQMYANGTYDGLRMSLQWGPTPSSAAIPFPVYSWEAPTRVCLPVLTGRVTVGLNTTRFRLEPGALNADDREIVIRNVTAGGKESHFRRDLVEYAFEVPGTERQDFTATVVGAGGEQVEVASIDVRPGPQGKVIVALDADAISVAIASVIIRNTSVDPPAETVFTADDLALELSAGGGVSDYYWVTAIDADGASRRIEPNLFEKLPSAHGPGNLLARALTGTIDPTLEEYLAANPGPNPPKWRTRVDLLRLDPATGQEVGRFEVPADRIVNGGFHFAFEGEEAFDHALEVFYNTGERDYVRIQRLRLIVANPLTGRVIKTIEVPAPPKDEPLGIGAITNDTQPPLLTGSPVRLNSFDPSTPLTFTFSESMDADSIRQNAIVERVTAGGRERVQGAWRVYAQNRSATFVPDAPLRIGEEYSITFVGADALAGEIAPGAQPVTDLGRNAIATLRVEVKTFAPRIVASVIQGANGRPMDEINDIEIRRSEENGLSKTYLFATTGATDGPKLLVFDATVADATREIGVGYGGRVQKALTLVTDIGRNGNPPLTFRRAQDGPSPACGPVGPAYTGDLAVSAGHNLDVSFMQAWYPGGPTDDGEGGTTFAPCLLTSRLLTANPDTLSTYTRPGTIHATGFAAGVATIRHEQGVGAFTAVREVGLFATDIGPEIPEPLPQDRQRPAFVAGDYYDVVAFQDRLLAANNGGRSLDIYDANLAQLGSVALPGGARHIVVAEDYGADEDGDGFIRPAEVRNLAFVATRECPGGPACNYTIQIIDLKNFSNPEVIGYIQMPGFMFGLDIDPSKRRLFATGYTGQGQQSSSFYMIDVSRPSAFAADRDQDGLDDRIVWRKEFPTGVNAPRIDQERGLAYIPVLAEYGARKGRLEIWAVYDNCCDLAVDFAAAPAGKQAGSRDGLLRKEREALRLGIKTGLAQAEVTCSLNAATVTILEQGSGACLWRGRCDDNYQPGVSDHDFEVFVPLAAWNVTTPSGKNVATCAADVLTETFIDPVTGESKKIALPNGDSMSFDDITFFAEVRELFETATFDVERSNPSGSDAVGDMGLGRRSLLLKWLLEGAYVTGIDGYTVEGRQLDAILNDLKNATGIPRLEGYEWSVLQDFNLAKSKAFLRVAGASDPNSAFHKLFVKQLHDAGKAGIRATMARLVSHPVANAMVLDVTRDEFDTSACYEITATVTNPLAWPAKPCTSFEEYVASAAARTLRENVGLFAIDEVVNQVHRFFRVKSDRERIVSEQKADAFVALAARFIAASRTLTQPIYNQTLPADPDAAQRTANMTLAEGALANVLRGVKLPVTPHVFSRGFRNGTGLRVAMYRADASGTGSLEKEVRVDLAGGEDRYLSYVRNPDGSLALVNGKAHPLFQLTVDLTQGFSQPRGISFVIDLPDRRMKESNRQNNVGGFFYYVLDRSSGARPTVPTSPHFPLADADLLRPSPECYDSPTLRTTQQLYVGGEYIGDEVVLGRREAVTIYLTVQNMSAEAVHGVLACSNVTNRCYDVGTLQAGESRTIQIDYVTPDEDTYVDGTPSAFSPEGGVIAGAPTRLIVNGSASAIQPLMDEAAVRAVDSALLDLEIGGTVVRHYRIVGRRTGLPKPGMTVAAEQSGFFGAQEGTRALTFTTNRYGEICTSTAAACSGELNAPDRGLQIPYVTGMVTGTTYSLRLTHMDGEPITAENATTFSYALKDRKYSQSYSVGAAIEGTLSIPMLAYGIGGSRSGQRSLELSRKGGFETGPSSLDLAISTQKTSKDSGTFNFLPSVTIGVGVGEVKLDGSVGISLSDGEGLGKKYSFTFVPNANPTGPPRILDFPQQCALAAVTLQLMVTGDPLIAKVLDLFRNEPCGSPQNYLSSEYTEVTRTANDTAAVGLSFTSPIRSGSESRLGVSFGLSAGATAGLSTKHEDLYETNAASGAHTWLGSKQSYGLVGTMDYSSGLSATYGTNSKPLQDAIAVDKFKKAMGLNLTSQTPQSGSYGVTFEYGISGTRPKQISITYSQPKAFGWKASGGSGSGAVNLGGGLPTTSISYTLRRPEDIDEAIATLANIQAIQAASAAEQVGYLEFGLLPTKLNEELGKFRNLMPRLVAPYSMTAAEGSGAEMPFGLKGKWLGAGLGATLRFKSDSKTTYPIERGVIFEGETLPLQKYTRDAYLPATDLGLGDLIGIAWDALETSFEGRIAAMSAVITPGGGPVVIRSQNTATMTIDGTNEAGGFDANLYSYTFRPVPGPARDAHMLPSDTAGPAGQPHYGVGGFHQFSPDAQTLASPAPLVIDYHDEDIVGLDESTFAIYKWNAETADWDHLGGTRDAASNTVSTAVTSFGLYTLAPRMPAREIALTAVDQGALGAGEDARRRFRVTSGPLVNNDGTAVPDGTLYTVRSFAAGAGSVSYGTVLSPDADASRENVQVAVVNGTLTFDVEYPSPNGLYLPGRLVIYSTTGTAFGSVIAVPASPGGRP